MSSPSPEKRSSRRPRRWAPGECHESIEAGAGDGWKLTRTPGARCRAGTRACGRRARCPAGGARWLHHRGRGAFQTALFSADDGTLFLAASRIGFVVALAEPQANVQAIRGGLEEAVSAIDSSWAPATPAATTT